MVDPKVWKIQDFPVPQILREINLRESACLKNSIIEFLVFGKFQPLENEKFILRDSEPTNVSKSKGQFSGIKNSLKLISRKI